MEIAIQSSDEVEQLRTRLRKMTDAQLVSFGKAARSLCRDPKCPEVFKRQTGRGAGRVETKASQDAVMDLPQWCFSASKVGRRMRSEQRFRASE